jgi:phosphotriesterase-related protein
MIRTVLGDIEVVAGPILAHEHLQIDLSHNKGLDNVLGENEEADITTDLRNVANEYGLKAVADLSVPGSGRNVDALRRISLNSGVAVIAATGFYWEPLPPEILKLSKEQLSSIMVKEIEQGVGDSGPRCGVIKIGTDNGEPDEAVERLFSASVSAAMSTGASIVTHTSKPNQAKWHLDIFKANGMNISRVLISHLHKFADFSDIANIAESGAFIGFDQIGFKSGPGIEHVVDMTVQMYHAGFVDQLILASDIARKSRLLKNGGTSYGTVFSSFLNLLKERGISDKCIEKIMHDNPKRILSIH